MKSMLRASNPCSGHQIYAPGIKSMLQASTTNQHVNQSNNQPINKSTNQQIRKSTNNKSTNQPMKQ
jgi:hypothetical protein